MTLYKCHCGDVHDSAMQSPCPQAIAVLAYPGAVRAILTTELDRFMLAAALRARHPVMTASLQALHDRLLPTADERRKGREFAETMARGTPEERATLIDANNKRCDTEAAFIEAHAP